MEGDHAIEQQMRLALVDDLHPSVLCHEHGQLAEMGAEKVPDSLLGASREREALLQAVVGLVGGDHQILLDRGAGDLPVGALLLVHGAHVGDDEAGGKHGLLNRRPDGVPGVVEDHRDPAPRLENTLILLEAPLHQALVFGQTFLLESVDDGLGRCVGQHAVPGFDQEIEIGVVDVLAERRVGEDVVHRVVGNIEGRRRARGHDATGGLPGWCMAEGLDQPGELVSEVVPRRDLGNLRADIIDAAQILIDLRVVRWCIPSENRHSPDGLLHEVEQHVTDAGLGVGIGPTPHRRQGVRGPGQKEVMDVRDALRRQTRAVIHVLDRQPVCRNFRWNQKLGDASDALAIIVVGLLFVCLAIHAVSNQ